MSIRIKSVAYGRHNVGRRVKYLLAPKPDAGPVGIPEEVVLYRWRRRQLDGYRFKGARLMPSVWRAMAEALGNRMRSWRILDVAEIDRRIHCWRADYRRRRDAHGDAGGNRGTFEHLSLPSSVTVHALIAACGARRLRALIKRHHAFRGTGQSGVPDLFLYQEDASGRLRVARFVEVKKPEERLSDAQAEEIAFMRSMGLEALVFRLREPKKRAIVAKTKA